MSPCLSALIAVAAPLVSINSKRRVSRTADAYRGLRLSILANTADCRTRPPPRWKPKLQGRLNKQGAPAAEGEMDPAEFQRRIAEAQALKDAAAAATAASKGATTATTTTTAATAAAASTTPQQNQQQHQQQQQQQQQGRWQQQQQTPGAAAPAAPAAAAATAAGGTSTVGGASAAPAAATAAAAPGAAGMTAPQPAPAGLDPAQQVGTALGCWCRLFWSVRCSWAAKK